jgi:hypothetical protein
VSEKAKSIHERAVDVAYQYGQIDGAHHKAWVIDQMVRILAGGDYDRLIKEYESDGEYEWDTGITP